MENRFREFHRQMLRLFNDYGGTIAASFGIGVIIFIPTIAMMNINTSVGNPISSTLINFMLASLIISIPWLAWAFYFVMLVPFGIIKMVIEVLTRVVSIFSVLFKG